MKNFLNVNVPNVTRHPKNGIRKNSRTFQKISGFTYLKGDSGGPVAFYHLKCASKC